MSVRVGDTHVRRRAHVCGGGAAPMVRHERAQHRTLGVGQYSTVVCRRALGCEWGVGEPHVEGEPKR